MTHPRALKDWFSDTGLFEASNNVSLIPNAPAPLDELLKINTLPAGYVCLLLKARIIRPNMSSPWSGGDHWVVMTDNANNNKIEVHTARGIQIPTPLGSEISTSYYSDPPNVTVDEGIRKKREELEAGTLNFRVYTWGSIVDINYYHGSRLSFKKFWDNYFGFVWARRK